MENNLCIRTVANSEQIADCKQTITELDASFDLLSNALSLVGNKVRLKILFLLFKEKKLCVCDLSDILKMKISAISQHLRKLKDRNLIVPNRKSQTVYYSLTKEYKDILMPFFNLIDNNKLLDIL
ncbi:MAG TPA: ArsR family transcriptional regulator [Crocinitomix sp.]|nr:ArsR family transcriptional regulator [Crocinitomix sp.]